MTFQIQDSSVTRLGNHFVTGSNTRLLVLSGGTLHTNGYNITGNGTFSDTSNGHLIITSPNGIQSGGAQGNIQTATRLFSSNGIYEYAGSTTQVTGNALPATINGLIINNASGVTVTQPVSINNGLTLASGLLHTGTTAIVTLSDRTTVTGGSHTAYIDGPVSARTSHTNPVLLPVGKNSKYAPVQITAAGTSPTTYLAEYFNGNNITINKNNLGNSNLTHVDSFQYWDINRTSGTEYAYLTLPFDGSSNLSALTNAAVAHYNSTTSNWESMSQTNTSGSVSGGTVTSGLVNSFSPFTIGSLPASPLFVELLSFDVRAQEYDVAIQWQTAREEAGDAFEIEHSTEGATFTSIGMVTAKGLPSSYSITDRNYQQGTNLYRLKLLHNNGSYSYSPVRMISIAETPAALTLQPNPASDRIHIHIPTGSGSLYVTDAAGRVIYQESNIPSGHKTFTITEWVPGIYFVQYRSNGQSYHTKFIKE